MSHHGAHEAKDKAPDNRPKHRIFLFDVDGTLTPSRKRVTPGMEKFLNDLRKKAYIAIVGGSDLVKQQEQLGEHIVREWDYVFSENGLVAYKEGNVLGKKSISDFLGEGRLKEFLNFCLGYMSTLDIPVKRGTFIEFRTGMINVCPIGRNCSQAERDAFEQYDKVHKIRETFVNSLKARFPGNGLKYSIGGQISFDVFPEGWDKTYCLPTLVQDGFTEIHFFGDKTSPGGNDHEIFVDPRVKGHTVKDPDDTQRQVSELLASL